MRVCSTMWRYPYDHYQCCSWWGSNEGLPLNTKHSCSIPLHHLTPGYLIRFLEFEIEGSNHEVLHFQPSGFLMPFLVRLVELQHCSVEPQQWWWSSGICLENGWLLDFTGDTHTGCSPCLTVPCVPSLPKMCFCSIGACNADLRSANAHLAS